MKLGRWIPLGSLILLMCAHQGEPTLILGSMLMAATAAMTGGLIMGPLTIGGLIMMMMMAANNQNAQQRQTQQGSGGNIASTLESSQNLLNLLATLTGAASNLATSASTQQNSLISPTNAPKASKRELYNPHNFADLFAESSRNDMLRRQWKALSDPTTTTTTRAPVEARMNTDFWSPKPTTYFSPDTGFAVEPIPDDLLDIAMRLPQAKNDNMFAELFNDGTVSAGTGGSETTGSTGYSGITSPPKPISSAEQQLRWVASEPGDLFSSFPDIKEEDILSLVHKRATREALDTKFRLEDIANVTYANEKDPAVKDELDAREKQEEINTRIFRQLSAFDPFRCLPQLACNMQASAPTKQTGILNDYAYLLKTVFERDEEEEDDENEGKKPGSTTVKKQASSGTNGGGVTSGSSTVNVASEILAALTSQSKRRKKLDYKSPTKTASVQTPTRKGSSSKKKKRDDGDEEEEEEDDDDNDGFSSEEIPMDEDELDRILMKEKYEMEQAANEELLNDDPDMLPYILKSASKGPPYLGPDKRPSSSSKVEQVGKGMGLSTEVMVDLEDPRLRSSPRPGMMGGRGPGAYAQPAPLFSASKLARYRTEDLEGMSSKELSDLLQQVSNPGEVVHFEDGGFGDHTGRFKDILSSFIPKVPQMAVGFTRRRTHTGKPAFDDDPFFDDFDFRRRSMQFQSGPGQAFGQTQAQQQPPQQQQQQQVPQGQPKLRKVRRVVRRVKREESRTVARASYLRSMKAMLDAETDPAEVFRMATEAGAKIKSPRQCRFLFNGCPLNSSQLLGMIGNIRKAVMGLSNAQTLLSGNVNLAALAQLQNPQTQKDFEGNLATIGPNVVTVPPTTTIATTTTPAPPLPIIHQLSPMAPMQLIQPILGMPQSPPPPPTQPPAAPAAPPTSLPQSTSSQNTIVVPQIVQVPMPIQAPAPQQPQQPIFIQQPAPNNQMSAQIQQLQQQLQQQMQQQMQQQQQMQNPPMQPQPIFNIITDSGASQNGGVTSISHSQDYPSGDQLDISMMVNNGQQAQPSQTQPSVMVIPMVGTKTRKKVTIPASAVRPVNQTPMRVAVRPPIMQTQTQTQTTMPKNPAADLIDLFDDDNSDNYLLPQKTLIDTEIKTPTSIDSLQAAILAIEKINQAASDRSKSKITYLEDDETDDYKSKLTGYIKKPAETTPAPPKLVPAGMRLPNRKKDEGEDDDETSEEDDDEEDDDGEQFRYRGQIPDPLDPKRRNFVPVPTKETQFKDASTMTIPATQTFVKKRLEIQDSAGTSSSEEDEQQQQPSQRRMLAVTRRKIRRPKILYPQEEVEKPIFVPL